jgi:ParB family chromosome partitioning protein
MASGIKGHLDLFAALPEELIVVTEPGKPGYHVRNTLALVLDEGMVRSIMERGVLESIIVGRDGPDLVVLDGRQRVAHTLEANRRLAAAGQPPKKVPIRPTRAPQAEWGLLASHANINRPSPPTMLAAEARALAEDGQPTECIAAAMGKSVKQVEAYLRLLDCHEQVQAAVDDGMSMTVAVDLAALPRAKQVETLREMRAQGVTKGGPARRAVADAKAGRPVKPKSKTKHMVRQALLQSVVTEMAGHSLTQAEGFVLAALRWVLRDPEWTGPQCAALRDAIAVVEKKA